MRVPAVQDQFEVGVLSSPAYFKAVTVDQAVYARKKLPRRDALYFVA